MTVSRWWFPSDRGTEDIPLDENGLLVDGASDPLTSWQGKRLPELRTRRCLVLLGEPGLGKSTEVGSYVEAASGRAVLVDLATIGDRQELEDEIDGALTDQVDEIFFDSLDEARLRVSTILDSLVRIVRKRRVPEGGPAVRIICRVAEWPTSGKEKLEGLYGPGLVEVWRLAPLTRRDVEAIARERGLDPEGFLEALETANLTSLAAIPLTLNMLLEEHERGDLPERAEDLYRRSCGRLLGESNETRQDRHWRNMLDPRLRFVIAERMAACMIFCERQVIVDADPQPDKEGVVAVTDLVDGIDEEIPMDYRITEGNIREVLRTALFRRLGNLQFTFAHRAFVEYLAAQWVLRLSAKQRRQLLGISMPQGTALPPQLSGVAAWVAILDQEIFNWLCNHEPLVLLQSAHLLNQSQRAKLVDVLLDAFDRQDAFPEWAMEPAYSRLLHPDLAEKLAPWVRGTRGNRLARRVAIDIAAACRTEALRKDLLAVVEDESEDYGLRIRALRALTMLPGHVLSEKLRALALGQTQDDPDDELRGWALRYLWPEHLTVTELFASLTPPKHSALIGAYWLFVNYELVPGLRDDNVAQAIVCFAKLIERLTASGHDVSWFDNLAGKLWERALGMEPNETLAEALASFLASCAPSGLLPLEHCLTVAPDTPGPEGHEPSPGSDDPPQLPARWRRPLARAVVELRVAGHEEARIPSFYLLQIEDIDWIIDGMARETSDQRKPVWAGLIVGLWHRAGRPIEVYERLYELAQIEPAIRNALGSWIDGMGLDSEEAKHAQESWERLRRLQQHTANASAEAWTCERVRQVVDGLLDRASADDPGAWSPLVQLLYLVRPSDLFPTRARPGGSGTMRLEDLPAFPCLDESQRLRLADAAARYLGRADPGTDEPNGWWWRTDRWDWRPYAAIAAFQWLREHAPARFETLSSAVWSRWAPALIERIDHIGHGEGRESLIDICRRHAAKPLIDALCHRLERYARSKKAMLRPLLRLVESLNDDRPLNILQRWLFDGNLEPQTTFEVSRILERCRPERLLGAIRDDGSSARWDEVGRHAAILAGRVVERPEAALPAAIPAMRDRPALAREVLRYLLHELPRLSGVEESVLAELFRLLAEFPAQEDGAAGGSLGSGSGVEHFRQAVLRELAERGTEVAVSVLDDLAREFPERAEAWAYYRQEARRRHLANRYRPPKPADLLRLERDARRRLVRSDEELLELVLESLQRLEDELQGRGGGTPLARALWNESPEGWKPKDETFLSDFVCAHLRRDLAERGIVANREVEIRASKSGDGQRTDILVQTFPARTESADGSEPIATVVIEAKSCSNKELSQAMETQLEDRYLRRNGWRCGIYLVGWFDCPKWQDAKVAGRKVGPDDTMAHWRGELERQASRLSDGQCHIRVYILDAGIHGHESDVDK